MQLREMIDKYPQQYIAVAYTKKGIDSLIETATVLKVYPTLLDAYDNLSEINTRRDIRTSISCMGTMRTMHLRGAKL